MNDYRLVFATNVMGLESAQHSVFLQLKYVGKPIAFDESIGRTLDRKGYNLGDKACFAIYNTGNIEVLESNAEVDIDLVDDDIFLSITDSTTTYFEILKEAVNKKNLVKESLENKEDNKALYPILSYFEFSNLPPFLQKVSKSFHEIAHKMVEDNHSPKGGPEISAGLRKLLEAKDCMVRAALEANKNDDNSL